MRSTTDDILSGEEPVTPAEAANVVQSAQEQNGSLRVLHSILLDTNGLRLLTNVCEELAMGQRTIGTELMKDFGEGGFRHGDFTEVIEERNLQLLAGVSRDVLDG